MVNFLKEARWLELEEEAKPPPQPFPLPPPPSLLPLPPSPSVKEKKCKQECHTCMWPHMYSTFFFCRLLSSFYTTSVQVIVLLPRRLQTKTSRQSNSSSVYMTLYLFKSHNLETSMSHSSCMVLCILSASAHKQYLVQKKIILLVSLGLIPMILVPIWNSRDTRC